MLDDDERVVELSRMLSGQPDSDAARQHAAELLATAAGDRGR
jgi:DNA repair protein RecN (Recombination protein N)